MEARKWHLELNEARESDLPQRLEPVGYCRGATADKVRFSAAVDCQGDRARARRLTRRRPAG